MVKDKIDKPSENLTIINSSTTTNIVIPDNTTTLVQSYNSENNNANNTNNNKPSHNLVLPIKTSRRGGPTTLKTKKLGECGHRCFKQAPKAHQKFWGKNKMCRPDHVDYWVPIVAHCFQKTCGQDVQVFNQWLRVQCGR
jgi:hypothetical protein